MPPILPVGKLPASVVEALLAQCRPTKSVILGPRFGEDAAVIDLGGAKYLVAKTDPITFTSERLGWYAVNINANDIATVGARPRWFLATLLLPEGRTSARLTRQIFHDTRRACRSLGVALAGGHTEVTAGLDRPILVGQMLGEVQKSKLLRKDSQRPGDVVVMTKGTAIEGTAILARERGPALARKLGWAAVRRAERLLHRISVLPEAVIAARTLGVRALHDPTEGGALSGLYELARAGRVGLRVFREKIPVLGETREFARILGFDPLAMIASGVLLISVSPRAVPELLRALARRKIPAAVIGEARRASDGIEIVEAGRSRPLKPPARDEIARLQER